MPPPHPPSPPSSPRLIPQVVSRRTVFGSGSRKMWRRNPQTPFPSAHPGDTPEDVRRNPKPPSLQAGSLGQRLHSGAVVDPGCVECAAAGSAAAHVPKSTVHVMCLVLEARGCASDPPPPAPPPFPPSSPRLAARCIQTCKAQRRSSR